MSFLVGMAQILVEGGAPEANLQRAERRIREAAGIGCALVVLPECLDLGWTHPSARAQARPIPGAHYDRLAAAASAHRIHVVAGLVERDGESRYNAAVLIGPRGDLLLLHRKINELEIAQDLYAIGDRLGVARTELGTLGVSLCADNFHNSLAIGHVLCRMGAQLILAPSAWAVSATHDNEHDPYGDPWRERFATLGRLYGVTCVAVSSVGWIDAGPWAGSKGIGCSMAVDPNGEILAQAPYGPDAEVVRTVRVEPRAQPAKGTALLDALAERGHTGP